jgi:hypothetical protein
VYKNYGSVSEFVETRVANGFSLEISLETCRDSIIQELQAVNESRLHDARSTLKVLELLPSNTRLPYNHFLKVVTTGILVINRAIKDCQFDNAQWALEVIRRLPSNTRVRRNHFSDVIATGEDVCIRAIKYHKIGVAKSALDIMQRLTDLSITLSKNNKTDLLLVSNGTERSILCTVP